MVSKKEQITDKTKEQVSPTIGWKERLAAKEKNKGAKVANENQVEVLDNKDSQEEENKDRKETVVETKEKPSKTAKKVKVAKVTKAKKVKAVKVKKVKAVKTVKKVKAVKAEKETKHAKEKSGNNYPQIRYWLMDNKVNQKDLAFKTRTSANTIYRLTHLANLTESMNYLIYLVLKHEYELDITEKEFNAMLVIKK